jgi:putative transcriptional regulator
MDTKIKLKSGSLLLAEPFMDDPNFKRTVVMLSEHTQKGTLGFVINRTMPMLASDVLPAFPDFDAPLFYGGPVDTDSVHFLHTKGDLIEGSYKVMPGVWWGGHFDQLKLLIEMNLITSANVRFYLGYSGWDPGQLQDEIDDKAWIIHKGRKENIFTDLQGDDLWKHILNDMGGDFKVMADFPENPQYN